MRPVFFLQTVRPLRRLLPIVVLAAGLAGLHACGDETRAVPRDVLIVTVDTLRADRLGLYGHADAVTPNFDRLGALGRRFDAAYTPFPRTTPALATLLTGRWPQVHGSREVSQPVKKDQSFLAQSLKTLGFTTLGVSANGAAGERQNLAEGFDDMISAHELGRTRAVSVTDAAVNLLQGHQDAERLFLWVHYVDPHFPYIPHPDAVADADTPSKELDGSCAELVRYAEKDRSHTAHVVSNRDGRSAAALADCKRVYDQEIAVVDRELGRLFAAWAEARGGSAQAHTSADPISRTLGTTLVIATADHGENQGEWELYYQHGPNVHDASLRVPLILAGPGIETGVDADVAGLEDIMPTVLAALGMPKKERPPSDGVDLSTPAQERAERRYFAESGSALLLESFRYVTSGRADRRNCTNGPRFSLCEDEDGSLRLYDHLADPDLTEDLSAVEVEHARALVRLRRQWPPESSRQRSVRQGPYKLVEIPRLHGGYDRALFHTMDDPAESVDLAKDHPQLVDALGQALDTWTATLPSHAGLGELSPEEEQELRALGYID